MRDADLRTGLDTIDGDAPSPEFLTTLFARLEREVEAADLDDELPSYSSTPLAEAGRFEPPTAREPGGRRRSVVVTAAAIALVVLVGLVVLQPGGGGNQVATTRLPHGYAASVLPDAVVQRGDGNVVVPTAPATGIDPIVPAWYEEERATLDDLGVEGGLSVPFDLRVPAETVDCLGLRRTIDIAVGVRDLPCGGASGALLFADDAAAVDALDLLVGHLEGHSSGTYQLGVVLERLAELDARLGDEAEAFVLEQFIDARIAADVVVIAWRSDNLVQFVWDIQDRGTPGGVDALIAVAQRIERRTAAQQQSVGGG
jgi:hypothetical protein